MLASRKQRKDPGYDSRRLAFERKAYAANSSRGMAVLPTKAVRTSSSYCCARPCHSDKA